MARFFQRPDNELCYQKKYHIPLLVLKFQNLGCFFLHWLVSHLRIQGCDKGPSGGGGPDLEIKVGRFGKKLAGLGWAKSWQV